LGLRWAAAEQLAALPASGFRQGSQPTAQVLFWGALPQPALVQHMQQCTVMVVPSRMEPMGMVVAEGLATGCTLVVARQGGLPEVGGAFCHYFAPEDVQDLTRALHEALTHPLRPDPVALQQHLRQFTVGYSVERVLHMLGAALHSAG
jgi:glycosyltransferase involved in cell wall biosynthesis